jgi:hypothetical protein
MRQKWFLLHGSGTTVLNNRFKVTAYWSSQQSGTDADEPSSFGLDQQENIIILLSLRIVS